MFESAHVRGIPSLFHIHERSCFMNSSRHIDTGHSITLNFYTSESIINTYRVYCFRCAENDERHSFNIPYNIEYIYLQIHYRQKLPGTLNTKCATRAFRQTNENEINSIHGTHSRAGAHCIDSPVSCIYNIRRRTYIIQNRHPHVGICLRKQNVSRIQINFNNGKVCLDAHLYTFLLVAFYVRVMLTCYY